MKRLTAFAFAAIASFITVSGVFAQQQAAVANVPFSFTVRDKTLPPGTYVIQSPEAGLVLIQNRARTVAVMTIVAHESTVDQKGPGKLVFSQYGDQYFLREILCPAAAMSDVLPTSKQEKRARVMEALLPGNSEVLLAMQ
jgi:hypothetical protein